MTPPSPFPLELSAEPQASSLSSSFSNPIFFDHAQSQDQGGGYSRELKQLFRNDQEIDELVSHGGWCDHDLTIKNESEEGLKSSSIWNKNEEQSETSSVKWMPSKMRMMRKMISSERSTGVDDHIPRLISSMHKFDDQKRRSLQAETYHDNSSSSNSLNNSINTAVRVCADCNTTKTPLWRSGPTGPKTLCNACGIRQRKARRAMAAANGTIVAANPPSMKSKLKEQHKEKRSCTGYVPKFKKKCGGQIMTTPISHGRKKLCLEDFTISLSQNSAFQRVFPQDEKEAAILLMALSYGLVHG